eukprot:8214472-Prorocentrum_lima.AAC.1
MLDLVYTDDINDTLRGAKSDDLPNLAVARTCSLKEADKNPKAKAALDKEWERLKAINTWGESIVQEWKDVAKEARNRSEGAH